MRPLDFLGRIKVKLGIVIVLAVVAAFVVNEVGINSGLSRDLRIAIAVVLALIMVQLLARGMIRPLREMAAAAQTIAKGRYGLRVSATSRDEVGELARAFNAMAADLAEVDRQRRELVANVSHELRTPITGLQAVLENIVDGVTPPDLDTLGTALAQTQRLGRLVAQLLDLSRLDSGARLIEPEELDLASLCRQAVSEATLARDDVTVVSAVGPGTVLSADGALLAQVLANLLDNAVRHSPSGGTVRVEARPSGANLEISVVDDGPGIPQAERARVFERFSRLDAGRAADAGGAGLGLAIAKEIVELHGGSIAVSDPAPAMRRAAGRGRETTPGCRMVVVLPLRGEPTAGESTAGESTDGPVHAGKGDMDVRERGAGRAEGRPGERGPSGDEGAGLGDPADALAPAKRPEETGDEAVRGEIVRGEEAGASSPGTPDGGEQAEAGQGELADQPDAAVQDANAAAGLRAPHTLASNAVASSTVASDTLASDTLASNAVAANALASNAVASNAVASNALASNPAYDRAGQLARAALGTGVGMFAGLFIGMAVSVILGLDTVVVLLFVVGGTIAGASRGSSWAHRPAPAGAPPAPWQGAVPSHMPVSSPPPAYVPPPLFPRPELPDAPRWLLPAAAAAGLVAAVAQPDASPGLGFVLTAVAMGAAAFPVVLPLRRGRITPWTVAFGLLAYALVSVALFRDADWLVGPVLLAAFGVGSLAVSGGGRGWLAVIKGGVSVVFALLPLPWFLAGPLRRLKRRRMLPTLVSALVTVVLLAVFGLLFSSADAVFSAFLSDLLRTPDWVRSLPYRIFVFCVFAGLAAAAVLVGL
ncbi:ATP-binding protein, partial [Microbispora rosea]